MRHADDDGLDAEAGDHEIQNLFSSSLRLRQNKLEHLPSDIYFTVGPKLTKKAISILLVLAEHNRLA